MNKLILTVGLPRIGKTTWCMEMIDYGTPIVNPDSIRLAIHGQPFISEAEPFVWATAKTMVSALFLAGHKVVVVDATNTTRSRRDFWRSSKWNREYKVFGGNGPEDVHMCIGRAIETCKTKEHADGLVAAINRMAEGWEPIEDHERDGVVVE